MRVITGEARGRRLATLSGDDVRPTTDKVKEALFSIIQFDIEGRRVLDLFAGSGQLGIEALSRGAKSAVFVDLSRDAVNTVNANLEATRLSDRAVVVCADARAYLSRCREVFELVFLDPPYKAGLLEQVLPALAGVLSDGAAVVCEAPAELELPGSIGGLTAKKYKYGKTALTVYRL